MTDILPALAAKPQTAMFHLVEGSLVVLVVPGLVALEELPGQEVAGRQGVRHSPEQEQEQEQELCLGRK